MLEFEQQQHRDSTRCRRYPCRIMMNVGNPDRAFDFAGIPHHGVGLARLEFIINRMIGVHPRALLEFDTPERRTEGEDRQADRRLFGPGQLLRRQARRRHRADRRRVRAGAGHRAPLGLQVERIRESDRRQELRAARGKPDARLPRRLALRRPDLPALLRARMPRAEAGARRHGPHQRAGHGAVRAHRGRGARRSPTCSRRTACSAARTGSRSS